MRVTRNPLQTRTADLRVALISGNYNMVRDGPTQALNRLVAHLIDEGAAVRVYSPTIEQPAFEPAGELISLPSMPIPGRSEYRVSLGLPESIREDLERFSPNLVHVASPDPSAHRAVTWARKRGIPVLGSVHTRFDTYPRYYKLGWLEPVLTAILRRFYQRCDGLVAPSRSMVDLLLRQQMNAKISIWSRGVDRNIFDASRRDNAWRRGLGISDDDVVIGFLGRLVLEKGLDVLTETIAKLDQQGISHKVLIVGDGPARKWLSERLPNAVFVGFQQGQGLGKAVASMDILFNPSATETFGNVTLEAMACGVPVVAAAATGSDSLVINGVTGSLSEPRDVNAFALALQRYVLDQDLRLAHGAAGEFRSRSYCWDTINRGMVETYCELVGGGSGLFEPTQIPEAPRRIVEPAMEGLAGVHANAQAVAAHDFRL